jgi:hypothetical protein
MLCSFRGVTRREREAGLLGNFPDHYVAHAADTLCHSASVWFNDEVPDNLNVFI